jgi:hypothetical protein
MKSLKILSVFVFLLIAAVLGLGTPAMGQAINACVKNSNGAVRFIVKGGITCPSRDELVSWNIQGAQGSAGLPGATGPAGPAGPQGQRALQGRLEQKAPRARQVQLGQRDQRARQDQLDRRALLDRKACLDRWELPDQRECRDQPDLRAFLDR